MADAAAAAAAAAAETSATPASDAPSPTPPSLSPSPSPSLATSTATSLAPSPAASRRASAASLGASVKATLRIPRPRPPIGAHAEASAGTSTDARLDALRDAPMDGEIDADAGDGTADADGADDADADADGAGDADAGDGDGDGDHGHPAPLPGRAPLSKTARRAQRRAARAAGRPRTPRLVRKKPWDVVANKILAALRAKDPYGFFLEPVDTQLVTDYLSVVATPMDLATMQRKLDARVYLSLDEVAQDFALLIRNAKAYNAPSTVYWRHADRLERQGNAIFEREKEHVATLEDLMAETALASHSAAAAAAAAATHAESAAAAVHTTPAAAAAAAAAGQLPHARSAAAAGTPPAAALPGTPAASPFLPRFGSADERMAPPRLARRASMIDSADAVEALALHAGPLPLTTAVAAAVAADPSPSPAPPLHGVPPLDEAAWMKLKHQTQLEIRMQQRSRPDGSCWPDAPDPWAGWPVDPGALADDAYRAATLRPAAPTAASPLPPSLLVGRGGAAALRSRLIRYHEHDAADEPYEAVGDVLVPVAPSAAAVAETDRRLGAWPVGPGVTWPAPATAVRKALARRAEQMQVLAPTPLAFNYLRSLEAFGAALTCAPAQNAVHDRINHVTEGGWRLFRAARQVAPLVDAALAAPLPRQDLQNLLASANASRRAVGPLAIDPIHLLPSVDPATTDAAAAPAPPSPTASSPVPPSAPAAPPPPRPPASIAAGLGATVPLPSILATPHWGQVDVYGTMMWHSDPVRAVLDEAEQHCVRTPGDDVVAPLETEDVAALSADSASVPPPPVLPSTFRQRLAAEKGIAAPLLANMYDYHALVQSEAREARAAYEMPAAPAVVAVAATAAATAAPAEAPVEASVTTVLASPVPSEWPAVSEMAAASVPTAPPSPSTAPGGGSAPPPSAPTAPPPRRLTVVRAGRALAERRQRLEQIRQRLVYLTDRVARCDTSHVFLTPLAPKPPVPAATDAAPTAPRTLPPPPPLAPPSVVPSAPPAAG